MTPQKQLYLHRPDEGQFGDCFRAAIACVLDLPVAEVPHFCLLGAIDDNGAYMVAAQQWLGERGLVMLQIPFTAPDLESVLATVGAMNPGIHYLLTGTSRNNVNHNVICLDDKIAWDPSIEDSGIVGPASDGFWWINFFAVRV